MSPAPFTSPGNRRRPILLTFQGDNIHGDERAKESPRTRPDYPRELPNHPVTKPFCAGQ